VIVLQTENLSKQFTTADGTELVVLQPTSFVLERAATLAIVGPSGSGKTTLLGLCAGLDAPSGGSVQLCGHALNALNEDQRAAVRNQHVGFVFQNFQLLLTLTALENVMVPLELRGLGAAAARKQAMTLLERVGLGQRAGHYTTQLSGGEQQRVALARGFVTEPDVLFADEPTGNLDGANAANIADLLFEMNQQHGTALVLSTHDLPLARRTGRILRLAGGVMVADETVAIPA